MFIWRACDDILPTKQNLLQRAVISNDLCHFCLQETEHMLAFKIMRFKKKKKKPLPVLRNDLFYFILFFTKLQCETHPNTHANTVNNDKSYFYFIFSIISLI
jgi:hypothetical protein